MAESGLLQPANSLSPAAGLAGLDLSRPQSSDLVGTIRAAILAHHIVVFPDQSLTREQQFAFAGTFGAVEAHGGEHGEKKRRDVAHVMSNLDVSGNPAIRISPAANYHWHTDKPYRPAPPALTLLYAVEVPPSGAGPGGDTEFADTALAYYALPGATKRRIGGLRVAFRPAFDPTQPEVEHPLVRTHPETGRKALYTSVAHTAHIKGWTEKESLPLLEFLWAHQVRPEFTCRFQWQVGSLAFWDNRCAMHNPINDYHGYRRVMHRITLAGDRPR